MKKVFVAGHRGLVGSAICRRLNSEGVTVLTAERSELDLCNQSSVEDWFEARSIDEVYLAAAKVGGIHANDSRPAEFIYENLLIQSNVIHAAWRYNVSKLLFLGSSCIYPKFASQPITESSLLTGELESSNEPYAIAKIAGIAMCKAYRKQYDFDAISVMPTNLYGPGDNFDLQTSHVLPALIRKMHDAKKDGHASVEIWGSGSPRREFLHVDDLADACVFLMENFSSGEIVNVGWGKDITIRELAYLVAEVVGFDGNLVFDISKPDGTPRKLLDTTKINEFGWRPEISLRSGIEETYEWYCKNQGGIRV